MKIVLAIIKSYFRIVSIISPRLAARHAFSLFQKTDKTKLKSKEEFFYSSSSTFFAESKYGKITCYENGDPNGEIVFLVHGWNSNAGSMSGIGKSLVNEGFHVISFDLPAHGKSKEKYTNMIYCKDALEAVLRRVSTDQPISIVAHSFGSLVSAYTLSTMSIRVKNLVYLTCPDKVSSIFEEFRDTIGLGDKAYELMVNKTEQILKDNLEELTVLNKLELTNYEKLVLIHDVHDKVLPYSNSIRIVESLPDTTLFSYEKVGHYRMLWNPEIIETLVNSLGKEKKSLQLPRQMPLAANSLGIIIN